MSNNHLASNFQMGLKSISEQEFTQYGDAVVDMAIKSSMQFFTSYETQLTDWQEQIVEGDIDEDDLRWLLQARDDLINLDALKTAGLGKEPLESFINNLIDVIVMAIKTAP